MRLREPKTNRIHLKFDFLLYYYNKTTMDTRLKFCDYTYKQITDDIERDVIRIGQDPCDPNDKEHIRTAKCFTRDWVEEYYSSSPSWNVYHTRIRKALLAYKKNDKKHYCHASVPLKAYINWDVLQRSNTKTLYLAKKYHKNAWEDLYEKNKTIVQEITTLKEQIKLINEKMNITTNTVSTQTPCKDKWIKYNSKGTQTD